jgi:hypothetical protein
VRFIVMIALKDINLVSLGLMFFWAGCEACTKSPLSMPTDKAALLSPIKTDRFTIEPEALFLRSGFFTYKSELVISFGNNTAIEDNHEIIEVVGAGPRLHLTKKIDAHHFLEIFKDDADFLIKDHGGRWRKGQDNPSMYQMVVRDGLNLTAWIINQFDLKDRLVAIETKGGKMKAFIVKEDAIPKTSAFVKDLAGKVALFTRIESSMVRGSLTLDEDGELPILAMFDFDIVGLDNNWVRIKANMSLAMTATDKELSLPLLSNDEPLMVPVNVVPRFNELMKRELGLTNQ